MLIFEENPVNHKICQIAIRCPVFWARRAAASAARSFASSAGDGHLAGFCFEPWLFHFSILTVSVWKNAMGAMAKRHDECIGSHGKKATIAKSRLGQMSWRPCQTKNKLNGIRSGLHGAS